MADMFDKEELSIVGGLFPNALATAEAEKLAQQELAYKRFSGAAGTQNPFAGLAGLSGMFGTAAGQELRSLAGAQSPTMQLVSLRNQATKQFDTNTPEGLIQMAQFLNQQGDAAGARQAVMLAQGQAQRMATLEKTGAETTRALREKIGTPENQAEQAYYNNLLSKYPDTVEGRALAADAFAKWKTEQKSKVAAAGAPVMPGTAKVTDLRTATDIVKEAVDAPKNRLDTVKRIGIYANQVLRDNPTAVPQLQRELVKLAGDNQIGQNEVTRILGSSGFAGNIIEGVNMFLEGKPTNVKINDLLKGVKAIEEYYAGQYNSGRDKAKRVLLNSQLDSKIVDDLIPPAYQTSGQKAQGRVAPAVGTIVNGYSFSGGDPSKQANWKLVTPTAQ